jgi:predicted branched-subunit amino acid permease
MTTTETTRIIARNEFTGGMRAMGPLALGYLPFALLLGTAIGRTDERAAGWVGTFLIYGGSAHLAVVQMRADGAGLWTTVAAGALINLRLLVYSAALAPLWSGTTLRTKFAAAATVVDPTWQISDRRAREPGSPSERRFHYAGAATVLAVCWTTGVSAGMVLGGVDRLATHLSVAVPLCLVALVIPHLRVPGGPGAVVAATATAVLTRSWPSGTGLLVAMAAAAGVGLLTTRRRK